MESRQKAVELVEKYKPHSDWSNDYASLEPKANEEHAKQCALICVDEMIKALSDAYPMKNQPHTFIEYWEEVKQEIKKL